jgi:RimJ/RimL family protein N-acetyltransferase
VSALKVTASITGSRRLWLITTNDNTRALRFYQRQGFQLIALHFDAIEVSRKLKPEIPLVGYGGIVIRHELELEMAL